MAGGIKSYSTTAASNNASPPYGAPEGMAASGVNDTMRQMMADTRSDYENREWRDWGHTVTYATATTFTVATDVTSVYTANRPIKCTDSVTLYGYVSSSSYSAPNTTVTVVLDSGSLSASLTAVALGWEPSHKSINSTSVRGSSGSVLTTTGDILYASSANTPARLAVGTTKQVLNVASGLPAWHNFPAFDLTAFLTNGTSWTSPSDCDSTTVFEFTLVAGGGGGGGTNGASAVGQGGGAGGAFTIYLSGLAASTAYAYAIGSAGAGGASTGGTGGTGGSTSITIGGTTYTAAGGAGGVGTTTAAAAYCGTQGSITANGASGFVIYQVAGHPGQSTGAVSCSGASLPPFGGGGTPGLSGVTGAGGAATGYGAGGGGALGSTATGGAGAPGMIMIRRVK